MNIFRSYTFSCLDYETLQKVLLELILVAREPQYFLKTYVENCYLQSEQNQKKKFVRLNVTMTKEKPGLPPV